MAVSESLPLIAQSLHTLTVIILIRKPLQSGVSVTAANAALISLRCLCRVLGVSKYYSLFQQVLLTFKTPPKKTFFF